jgi:hypothetical protein
VSLRIEEPRPLRTVGWGTVAGGGLLTVFAGFVGPAALVGVVILGAGIALLDAVDIGRVARRQLGLFLLVSGGVVGAWALVVVLIMAIIGLTPDLPVLSLLAGAFLAVGGGMYIVRYAPVSRAPAPSRVDSIRRARAARRRRLAGATSRVGRLAG